MWNNESGWCVMGMGGWTRLAANNFESAVLEVAARELKGCQR